MITPGIIIRDLLLCLAVVICIAAAWFNFGRSYSENLKKEHLSRLEKQRTQKVAALTASRDEAAISNFLHSEEVSDRSGMEIFRTLLNRKQDKPLLLALIKNDSFSGRLKADFLGAACSFRNCDPEIIEELIRAGAELDRRDRYGRTPLMRAMLAGNIQAVHHLLNYGADPNLIDRDGRNITFYLPEKADEELLHQLRNRDVPFNISDHRGRTALMVYVDRYDDPETVRMLLKSGVRINARSHSGETAFETAVRRRHISSAEKLFLSGARYDSEAVKKISPEYRLHQWVRLGADKVKKQLKK
jgi:ankyrin repeat protein